MTAHRIPLTGGSEHRVSGRVRSMAWALEERAEPVEVECFRDGAPAEGEPGVMLFDRKFPIFLAVLEDEIYILVNCELLAGPVRARLVAVRAYVEYFAAHGYAVLYDHDAASRQPVERVLPQLPAMLAATGTSAQLATLAWDFRIAFVLIVPVFIGLGRLFRWNDPEPWVLTLTRAFVLGAVSSWMHYRQMRGMLAGRVSAVRQSLLLPDDHALAGGETGNQPQIFLPAPPSKGDLAGAAFILVLLVTAIALQMHAGVVAIFLAILIGGTAWTYWLSLSHVVFDADGVEGRGLTRRVRLSYADVETMREAFFGDTLRVSGRAGTFWMPHRLRDYGAAVAQLEERVEQARLAAARARDGGLGLLLVLALSLATPASAQSADPIAADRPGIADSGATIERGRIQFETGAQWESRPDEITIFVPALLRIGLWDRFEARIEGNTFSVDDAGGNYRSGLSPTSAGFKWSARRAEGRRPGAGVIARVFPRWGLGGFEAGRATADARLAVDWEFAEGFSLNPNAGIGWYDDDGRGFAAGLFAVTLAYQHGPVGWFVDAAEQTPEASGGTTAVVVDGGLAWTPRPNLQLDVSAGSRLHGETPPRLFIAVGVACRVRGWGRE